MIASDANGFNNASQALRDAEMFADTTVKTGKYASWNEFKSAYNGNVAKFIKEHKPKRSPNIKKWFAKNGTIDIQIIDGKEIWTYTSSDGISVPYIDGYVDFPKKYLHPDIQNGISIGKFTGDRNKDIKLAMEVLKQEYGLSKIPNGYVVHHDVENGLMQIVEKSVHELFTHVGGHSFYK